MKFGITVGMSYQQIEQLLTCPICLDRYQRPKVLPCQHTFCLEPCLERLASNTTKQLKCPECRAVHRIPEGGIQCFPNNRTILSFLEIPLEQISEVATRDFLPCQTCGSKEELFNCSHCQKSICNQCKHLHLEQLRMDLKRMIIRLRRAVLKISCTKETLDQKSASLRQNSVAVRSEISRSIEQCISRLREREKVLLSEVESIVQAQLRSLRVRQENMEIELASIFSQFDGVENRLDNKAASISEVIELLNRCKQLKEETKKLGKIEEEPCLLHKLFKKHFNIIKLISETLQYHSSSRSSQPSCSITTSRRATRNANLEAKEVIWVTLPGQGGHVVVADSSNHRIQVDFSSPANKQRKCISKPFQNKYKRIVLKPHRFLTICNQRKTFALFKKVFQYKDIKDTGFFHKTFGCYGNGDVSSHNKVVVSDSGNHRVQVFDKYGQCVRKFGSEGSELGQFKYPRGLAVDHAGNIIVADSGNNRIQIFQEDGRLLVAFGSWGTGDGQVKGLEGLAFWKDDIIVSDRENHRLQIF
uniref:RING-type domain-containing protein n=1 Tax=Latimeria chalumnae TaxID=7897 RepID=H3AR69_LATCH